MTGARLLAAARVAAAVSTVAALAAFAWLSIGHGWIPYLLVAALAAAAIGGWTARRPTQAFVLAIGPVWPLLGWWLLGGLDPLAIVVWVAAVAGLVLATAPLARWSVPRPWRVPLATWAMLVALAWPLVLARELDFSLVAYFEDGTVSGMWAGTPRDTAAFATGASAATLTALLLFDWLWARYGTRTEGRFTRDVAAPLTVGAAAAVAVGVYQGLFDLTWWSADVWPGLGRATGTLMDGNALGSLAALWAAPAAGITLLAPGRLRRAGGLALLVAAAVAVWASGSRTAFLGVLFTLGGIALALLRAGAVSRRAPALGAAAIVALAAVGGAIGGPGSAVRRVWDTLPSPSIASVGQFGADMWTRNGYGSAAVAMLRDHPLTGVGPGAFPLLAPDYAFRTDGLRIPPDNAQNWWRHQIAELGLVAGLVPIACSLLVLLAIGHAVRRGTPTAVIVAGALCGAAAMSMLGSPTANPLVLIAVTVLIFRITRGDQLAARHASEAQGHRRHPSAPGAKAPQAPQAPEALQALQAPLVLVWLLPLVWLGGSAWSAATTLRPPQRAEATGWLYSYGFSAPTPAANGAERRWLAHRAVAVVPTSGSRVILSLRLGPMAGTGDPVRVRVSTRERTVLDQALQAGDIASVTLAIPPAQHWLMVQFETSREGPVVDGDERALELTSRFE